MRFGIGFQFAAVVAGRAALVAGDQAGAAGVAGHRAHLALLAGGVVGIRRTVGGVGREHVARLDHGVLRLNAVALAVHHGFGAAQRGRCRQRAHHHRRAGVHAAAHAGHHVVRVGRDGVHLVDARLGGAVAVLQDGFGASLLLARLQRGSFRPDRRRRLRSHHGRGLRHLCGGLGHQALRKQVVALAAQVGQLLGNRLALGVEDRPELGILQLLLAPLKRGRFLVNLGHALGVGSRLLRGGWRGFRFRLGLTVHRLVGDRIRRGLLLLRRRGAHGDAAVHLDAGLGGAAVPNGDRLGLGLAVQVAVGLDFLR